MLYPLKFQPVFKDYIWGGRNLEQFGKKLPPGNVAESWEISCHPNGISIVSNGEFTGQSLPELIGKFGRQLVGTALPEKDVATFPLLIKLIDANDKLSVQVHPDDSYALTHEHGELGKNEMWHILSAKPGAKLIYDVLPGTNLEIFSQAVKDNHIGDYLKSVEVFAGDTLNIPAGLIHAIGEGIVLAEIQQNSDTTYRVFDYNRVDKNRQSRPLHVEKAKEVIDFAHSGRPEKMTGLTVTINREGSKKYLIANKYFSVELLDVHGSIVENADGSKFYIYLLTEGEARLDFQGGRTSVTRGESLLVPASMGDYRFEGCFKALKTYVPDLTRDIVRPLKKAGYTEPEIIAKLMN
ncbi:MAG TPA: mannose-6-phosphate isomerase [Firmicutes bacterium]|jgi:mannose-6-phosphate isomerase|nr:mannose-6-phosphate isomerase [Bacillota bacterium]